MSIRQQQIEWDVPELEVQIGVPIGYEVELSLKSYFEPVLYRITTFEEVTGAIQGTFFYSLDDGVTWINFPVGEAGQAFYSAYKMKLVINAANVGFIFAEKHGTVYRIRADGAEIIEQYEVGTFNSSGFEIDPRVNSLYISGEDRTLYNIDTIQELVPGDNSINLRFKYTEYSYLYLLTFS